MKHLAVLGLSIGLFAGIVGQGHAAPIGFGVEGDGSSDVLFSVDLGTGLATDIGTGLGAQFTDVKGLGFDPTTSVLYGIDNNNAGLLSIDTTTGFGTLIATLSNPGAVNDPGFAINSNGLGFLSNESQENLYSVNLNSGDTMLLGSMGAGIDGLAFIGDTLYGVDAAANALYTLDTVTGAATFVGDFGTNTLSNENGLASDGTFLYAGDDDGDYLRIDPTTGAATVVTGSGRDVEGLAILVPTTNPVPEPSTVLLFGSGLAGLALWRMRKGKNKTK